MIDEQRLASIREKVTHYLALRGNNPVYAQEYSMEVNRDMAFLLETIDALRGVPGSMGATVQNLERLMKLAASRRATEVKDLWVRLEDLIDLMGCLDYAPATKNRDNHGNPWGFIWGCFVHLETGLDAEGVMREIDKFRASKTSSVRSALDIKE